MDLTEDSGIRQTPPWSQRTNDTMCGSQPSSSVTRQPNSPSLQQGVFNLTGVTQQAHGLVPQCAPRRSHRPPQSRAVQQAHSAPLPQMQHLCTTTDVTQTSLPSPERFVSLRLPEREKPNQVSLSENEGFCGSPDVLDCMAPVQVEVDKNCVCSGQVNFREQTTDTSREPFQMSDLSPGKPKTDELKEASTADEFLIVKELLGPIRERGSSMQDFLDMVAKAPSMAPGQGVKSSPSSSNPSHMPQQTSLISSEKQSLFPSTYERNSWLVAGVTSPAPIVAVDVDEVLCGHVDGFRSFLQTECPNGALDLESVFYEAHNEHSLCRSRFIESGGFDKLDSVPGAVEAMQWLRSCGIRLEALASRPRSVREATKTSLKGLFPPSTFEDVHFVDACDKGRVCRSIGALALVDDQVQNAMNAAKFGVVTVLFDFRGGYPWAKSESGEFPSGVTVVESWPAACECLIKSLRDLGCRILDPPYPVNAIPSDSAFGSGCKIA